MGYNCELRPLLMGDWRRFAGDPDDQPEQWFCDGSPLGIEAKAEPRNIFPSYADQDAKADATTLASEVWEGNRKSAESDADAMDEVKFMLRRCWLQKYASKIQAKRAPTHQEHSQQIDRHNEGEEDQRRQGRR